MEEEEEAQRPDDQLRLPAGTALLLLWAGWGRGRRQIAVLLPVRVCAVRTAVLRRVCGGPLYITRSRRGCFRENLSRLPGGPRGSVDN
jgi:hypothetical protein